MKTNSNAPRGFTLLELMLSVSITIVLLGVLFNMTAVSTQALDRAQARVELSKRADVIFEQIRQDIEGIVIRQDANEWFFAGVPDTQAYGLYDLDGPLLVKQSKGAFKIDQRINEFAPPNICPIYFFTAAADKYDGYAGTDISYNGSLIDKGGDVSMVEYKFHFRNELHFSDGMDSNHLKDNSKLMLFRNIIHPDEAYQALQLNYEGTNVRQNLRDAFMDINPGNKRLNLESVLATHVYAINAVFNVEYLSDDDQTVRDYIILRPNTRVDADFVPLPTTIRRAPAISGKNRTFQPNENVATTLRLHGTKGLIANCPKLFTPGSKSGLDHHEIAHLDYWLPKPGINQIKLTSVELSLILLDEAGQDYLHLLNQGLIAGHMRQRELIEKHGYSFSTTIKFSEY